MTEREALKAHENLMGITKHSHHTAVHLQERLENLESCKKKKQSQDRDSCERETAEYWTPKGSYLANQSAICMWKLKPDELKSEINHEFLVVKLIIHWNKFPEDVADFSDVSQSWKDISGGPSVRSILW